MNKSFKCCICKKNIVKQIGNNPFPLKEKGRCCDKCNEMVILERLKMF